MSCPSELAVLGCLERNATLAETGVPGFLSASLDLLGPQNERPYPEGSGGRLPALGVCVCVCECVRMSVYVFVAPRPEPDLSRSPPSPTSSQEAQHSRLVRKNWRGWVYISGASPTFPSPKVTPQIVRELDPRCLGILTSLSSLLP